jgi:hypothetical protein
MAKQSFVTGQVLTAAQMTSLQQTAMLGGAASAKTASYTLVAADAGTAISMSNASATTITVNTALFAAGDTVQITNLGAGVCTITAGTATVNTSASLALAQYESGTLDFTSTSAAIFIKGAGAAAASGGLTLITETVASALTSLSFSSLGSYKQLMLIWSGIKHSGTGSAFGIRFNSNSGTVYSSAGIGVNGTTANAGADLQTSLFKSNAGGYPYGENANYGNIFGDVYGQLIIDNYTSTTKDKSYTATWGYYDNTNSVYKAANLVGFFDSTTAITSIDIFRTTGSASFSNIGDTSIRLYGIN